MIGALEAGMRCRAAAHRFGVAPSAAVKGRRLWLETGSLAPRAQGGDTRSGRIEAAGPTILARAAGTAAITLVEIAARLERARGARFAPLTVHRFFRRHGGSFKRGLRTPARRTARPSPRGARPGSTRSPIPTRRG